MHEFLRGDRLGKETAESQGVAGGRQGDRTTGESGIEIVSDAKGGLDG